MVLSGRAADPPSAIGFFLRLFAFIIFSGLLVRAGYWLIGPLDNRFREIEHVVRLFVFGPFLLLALYPLLILAVETLMHFVPTPIARTRSWKEATLRKAEENAALAAFTSAFFLAVVLGLHWVIGQIEDPISLILLRWSYWLSLASLAISAGAALMGFFVVRWRV
ncbi:hypothetical protein [Aminobacter sp. MET-1]|uniref:hypothetical protein n=1 Tax=Aminobacter sp. MET-1 TaxID=2951085 RepID=UPI00226A8887|nr:hypothetical protein [Aminobacter sp. MET-1]MCX8571109.1 hypothetical protein [Aminobacter sp. MET-1]MCX8573222.1 hypothetical protein [Aminobacter sp. MET-1]